MLSKEQVHQMLKSQKQYDPKRASCNTPGYKNYRAMVWGTDACTLSNFMEKAQELENKIVLDCGLKRQTVRQICKEYETLLSDDQKYYLGRMCDLTPSTIGEMTYKYILMLNWIIYTWKTLPEPATVPQ